MQGGGDSGRSRISGAWGNRSLEGKGQLEQELGEWDTRLGGWLGKRGGEYGQKSWSGRIDAEGDRQEQV